MEKDGNMWKLIVYWVEFWGHYRLKQRIQASNNYILIVIVIRVLGKYIIKHVDP